jgi:transcription antitermination factor NusG
MYINQWLRPILATFCYFSLEKLTVCFWSKLLYILLYKGTSMPWIVVQVKSQCEDYAIKNLEQSGFKCYCPKLTLQNDAKKIPVPMFRGYIFVEIDLANARAWKSISSHRGVYKMLGAASGMPALLPKGFVEALIDQGSFVEDLVKPVQYEKGQKIIFTVGPLSGISGIVHYSNKERVALLVELLGMHTIVQSTTRMIAPNGAPCEKGCSAAAIKQDQK